MSEQTLPLGFLAAGANIGIKSRKPDGGIIFAESPARFAAVVSQNACRAPSVARTARLQATTGEIRAVFAVSGNANALAGPKSIEDDQNLALALSDRLDVAPEAVLTASTGIVGYRLNLEQVISGMDSLLKQLSPKALNFAQAILTTDTAPKLASREIFVQGHRVKLHAISKGSGMIAPSLATTLSFITTDAEIETASLRACLTQAVNATLNQLTVDNEMSTNDQVILMASGYAENAAIVPGSADEALFLEALTDLLHEVARSIASDGEGATRRLEITVCEAPSLEVARALARSIAGSILVKTALFGSDPNFAGRMIATAGATLSRLGHTVDLNRMSLVGQGLTWFAEGACQLQDAPSHRRRMLTEPVVEMRLSLGQGEAEAIAYGCDLSYDYVKINADYSAITSSEAGKVAVNEQLQEFGPSIKKKVLIQALGYINQFKGIRAVIKIDGAAMSDPQLERLFAEDVLLLQSVGLLPIVVHGGATEITRRMERMGQEVRFIKGLRVTDSESMNTVEMVLTGSVNQRLVTAFNREGSRAVGLSGKDGALIRARKLASSDELGQVGEVASVDARLLAMMEQSGYLPVVSPVGLGEDGISYNIDSDRVAGTLAREVGAKKLVFMGDQPGLLEGDRVISEISADQLKRRLDQGRIPDNQRARAEAALDALSGGVDFVHLLDGRVQHSLISELFTDKGVGTLIYQS